MNQNINVPEARQQAHASLDAAGFFTEKTIEAFNLPPVELADNGEKPAIAYATYGNMDEAKTVVLEATPYSTNVDFEQIQLRMAAHQAALGPDFCVVSIQGFVADPKAFNKADREQFAKGSFAPITERMLRVADAVGIKDNQAVFAYGYSLGADAAVDLTHAVLTDPNRGTINITAVGAMEAARVMDRPRAAVLLAQNKSGKKLYQNSIDSNMPALNLALGIDLADPASKEKYDKEVMRGVTRYAFSSKLGNLAIMKAFGSDLSAKQLTEILKKTYATVVVGRQTESTISSHQLLEDLLKNDRDGLYLLEETNDHSADDNIRHSAGRIVWASTKAGFK